MKIPALLTVLALTCGVAMAQAPAPANNTETHTSATGESLGAKTKRAAHRTAEAVRRAGHKVADGARRITHTHKHASATSDDTRTMGAAGDDTGRRTRMDSAYDNYQKKHK